LILIPLFGVHYIVFVAIPDCLSDTMELVKLYMEIFLSSFQVSGLAFQVIIISHGSKTPTWSLLTRVDQGGFCYFDWQVSGTDSVPHQ
jgi:hypothetical protein